MPHTKNTKVAKKADVLIADPEPVARTGLIKLINSHSKLRVCAETDTLFRARELCALHKPKVLMMDLSMGDGFAFIKDLTMASPQTHVLIFTAQSDSVSVQRAFKAGACAFITRRDPISALLAALIGAVSGERHIGPCVELQLLDNLARGGVDVCEKQTAGLSNRELQVFQLLGQGRGTRDVAAELGVSMKTVETHRQRIKVKLGIATASELQRRAFLFREGAANRTGS